MSELKGDPLYVPGNSREAENVRRRTANLKSDRLQLAQLMRDCDDRNRLRHSRAHSARGIIPAPAIELRDFYGRTLAELQWQVRHGERVLEQLTGKLP